MTKKNLTIILMAISLILMALPFGVRMRFTPGPNEITINYYSYFNLMPIGYGNWFPMIAAILTACVIVLSILKLKVNSDMALKIILGVLALVTVLSWSIFNSFSIVSLLIFVLHIVAVVLQFLTINKIKAVNN